MFGNFFDVLIAHDVFSTGCVVPGAGAVEVAIADALMKYKPCIKGRAQLGIQAYADALLIIPKVWIYGQKWLITFLCCPWSWRRHHMAPHSGIAKGVSNRWGRNWKDRQKYRKM